MLLTFRDCKVSQFLNELKREQQQSKKSEKCPPNILYMDNGMAYIPDSKYHTFLSLYAEDISPPHPFPFFFSEQRSSVFKMHFDFDILAPVKRLPDNLIADTNKPDRFFAGNDAVLCKLCSKRLHHYLQSPCCIEPFCWDCLQAHYQEEAKQAKIDDFSGDSSSQDGEVIEILFGNSSSSCSSIVDNNTCSLDSIDDTSRDNSTPSSSSDKLFKCPTCGKKCVLNQFKSGDEQLILELAMKAQEEIALFYAEWQDEDKNHFLNCYITLAENKLVQKGQLPLMKIGVHVIFPNLYVNSDQALAIRQSLISALYLTYGHRIVPDNSWEKVIDESIYTSNGLRLIYSRKTDKCKECRGSKVVLTEQEKQQGVKRIKLDENRRTCPECHGNGKVDAGRAYLPSLVINHRGEKLDDMTEKFMNDRFFAVRQCSIRLSAFEEESKGFKTYNGAPTWIPSTDIKKKKNQHSKNTKTNNDDNQQQIFDEDKKALNAMRNKIYILRSDPRFVEIEKFVQNGGIGKEYSQTYGMKLYTVETKKYYIYTVDGVGSQYCKNIGAEHNSNHIYFFITTAGLSQKCFCRCDTIVGRRSGKPCKKYRSDNVKIPLPLYTELFGGLTNQNKKAGLNNIVMQDSFFSVKDNPNSKLKLYTGVRTLFLQHMQRTHGHIDSTPQQQYKNPCNNNNNEKKRAFCLIDDEKQLDCTKKKKIK